MGLAPRTTQIRALLLPGERILWEGRPEPVDFCLRGSLWLIPFSLLWCGFVVFWELSVLSEPAPGFFALWGVPFVVIGLYMVFGRFVVAYVEAGRTFYAVIDRRVLIVGGVRGRRVASLTIADLAIVQLDSGRTGVGTITFGATPMFMIRVPPGWPTLGAYGAPPAFLSIRDAASVYALLERTKSTSATEPFR